MEQSSSIDSRANAEHLKIGRFLYRTSMKEKDLGTSEITISNWDQIGLCLGIA